MKKNNRGFTLVELIVVVAIIGVVAGIVGLTAGTAVSARAQRGAESVNVLVSKCKAGCLSKTGDVHLTLSVEGGNLIGRYYENGSLISTDSLPLSGVTVSYTTKKSGFDPVTVALAGNPLTLSFDRATGAQIQPGGVGCTTISFDGGRVFTIQLIPSTGMHRLV